jgi:CheY-like chemotaxis protein
MSESEHIAVTVLVVEDECLVREDIVDYLQHSGCAVIEAESGERAIDICNSGTPVDVVFTDIQLRGAANGFDVADAFRAAHADIPIMYVSGNTGGQDRCVAGSLFFQKPYRAAEILNACLQLNYLARIEPNLPGLEVR